MCVLKEVGKVSDDTVDQAKKDWDSEIFIRLVTYRTPIHSRSSEMLAESGSPVGDMRSLISCG